MISTEKIKEVGILFGIYKKCSKCNAPLKEVRGSMLELEGYRCSRDCTNIQSRRTRESELNRDADGFREYIEKEKDTIRSIFNKCIEDKQEIRVNIQNHSWFFSPPTSDLCKYCFKDGQPKYKFDIMIYKNTLGHIICRISYCLKHGIVGIFPDYPDEFYFKCTGE